MNVEYYIAKKLFNTKEKNNFYTKPIFRIAILAIALSIAFMLISVMIVTGFKNEISSKIIGFGSHITINYFSSNQSYESEPISVNQSFYSELLNNKDIKSINVFATKAGVIKTSEEIHGVVLKGVSFDYDWSFFNENLLEGKVLDIDSLRSNDILISQNIAKILKLSVDDNLVMYFAQDPPRVRNFKIKGIYKTAMDDFDNLYVFGDIKHIQDLNSWNDTLVGGFEISINNFKKLDKITNDIYNYIPFDLDAISIKDKQRQIFDWLLLQDINIRVIITLLLTVAMINMITVLLILIFSRIRLIGILKSLGATNWTIRKIFLYKSLILVFKGLLLGNSFAFLFAFLQKQFSLISLDPKTYYMNTVPIDFDFLYLLSINIFTLIICYLVLIIPSVIISKITPVKAISFE